MGDIISNLGYEIEQFKFLLFLTDIFGVLFNRTVLIEQIDHVLDEAVVRLGLGSELAVLRESVITHVQRVRRPVSRKGWIGDDRLEAFVCMLWVLQCVLLFDVKLSVMHIMHDHIHTGEVVGGTVELLSVEVGDILYLFGYT